MSPSTPWVAIRGRFPVGWFSVPPCAWRTTDLWSVAPDRRGVLVLRIVQGRWWLRSTRFSTCVDGPPRGHHTERCRLAPCAAPLSSARMICSRPSMCGFSVIAALRAGALRAARFVFCLRVLVRGAPGSCPPRHSMSPLAFKAHPALSSRDFPVWRDWPHVRASSRERPACVQDRLLAPTRTRLIRSGRPASCACIARHNLRLSS